MEYVYINQLEITEEQILKAKNLIYQNGFVVLKNANDINLCKSTIDEYKEYVAKNEAYVKNNLDPNGHEKRLVNFHLTSESSGLIATNPVIMKILDSFFQEEAGVYSSLTFKYSTQQPVHRDTPHFYTYPYAKFVGVWSALEDIDPDSGPIFYHPNGHLFDLDRRQFLLEAVKRDPSAPLKDQLLTALDLYNGEVIRRSKEISNPISILLNIGDVVIWHPELPHGGSIAIKPDLTRWSMVCHCAPISIQVHQHDQFFLHLLGDPLPIRYGHKKFNGRLLAASGETAYM